MKNKIAKLTILTLLHFALYGCANMAQGPGGGKKDVTPPHFVESSPANGAVNVQEQEIEILFDEYLQIKNPVQTVVVSPPQQKQPSIKAIGKKILVSFKDSLKPNTTYSVDFGNAIGDYTENNPARNFLFHFATGDCLDTLTIAGTLLDAKDLSPLSECLVGIYSSEVDSLFTTTPLERIAKTDASGRFEIRGVSAKQYRIFALADMNGNYYFDQPGELIAVQDAPVPIPSILSRTEADTVYNTEDSTKIDTILTKIIHTNLPNDILLKGYLEYHPYQAFIKAERNDRKFFSLYFTKCDSTQPAVTPIIPTDFAKEWCIIEPSSAKGDTLKYWLTDSTISQADSLRIAIEYTKTDSAERFVVAHDTLWVNLSAQFLKNETKAKEQAAKTAARLQKLGRKSKRKNILKLSSPTSSFEIYNPVKFTWEYPVQRYNADKTTLTYKKDSTVVSVPHKIIPSDENGKRSFIVEGDLRQGVQYTLTLDSAFAYDYFGNHNDKNEIRFNIKEENRYGAITIHLESNNGNEVVQLLNKKDLPIRIGEKNGNNHNFRHVTPGEYYVRMFIDENKNGKWDTGNYRKQVRPEPVYYFPKSIRMRSNWSVTEDWNPTALPLDQQRPKNLQSSTKQKNQRR